MEVTVGEGVVSELEAGVDPRLQERDTRGVRGSLGFELALVDEPDRGNAVAGDRFEKPRVQRSPRFDAVPYDRDGREVVERDRDATRRFLRRGRDGDGKRREKEKPRSQGAEPPLATLAPGNRTGRPISRIRLCAPSIASITQRMYRESTWIVRVTSGFTR
jgi:hypothetical protein